VRPLAIFDLDGTLVDSVVICTDIVNAMLDDRGSTMRVSRALTRQYVSIGGARMMSALLGAECGDPQVEIAEFRVRYAETRTPASSLFPGVRDGLEGLKAAGVLLAICSSKPQHLCDKVLAEVGVDSLFEMVVGSQPGLPAKPDPALLDYTIGLVHGPKGQLCYVGDHELDRMLAERAGVPFILAGYGYGDPRAEPQAELIAETFPEVSGLVARLLGVENRFAASGTRQAL
jgi:phosphoglycolate phosphatase